MVNDTILNRGQTLCSKLNRRDRARVYFLKRYNIIIIILLTRYYIEKATQFSYTFIPGNILFMLYECTI